MIKKSLFLVVLLCAQVLNVSASPSRSLLILGDSLSAAYGMRQEQGWVSILNQRFNNNNSPYHIINASISGETTAGGLARLPKVLENNAIDYMLIELGGNDGLRGFPTPLIKNNLLQIIQLAKQKNIEVALMEIKIPPNYGPRYNKLFTANYQQLAQEQNIPLVPFFMEDIAVNPNLMLKDGIHPNIDAQPIIADFMETQLTQLLMSKK